MKPIPSLRRSRKKALWPAAARQKPRRPARPKLNNYTDKELRRLHGPVYQCNLGQPLSWAEFKGLTEYSQKAYLQHLVGTYTVGAWSIARVLGWSGVSVTRKLEALKIATPERTTRANGIRFKRAMSGKPDKPLSAKDTAKPRMPLRSTVLCFRGRFQPSAVTKRLDGLFPTGTPVKVRIEIERC